MELETERLFLREFQQGDDQPMAEYNRAPQARLYLLRGQGTEQHARRWVTGAIAESQRQPRRFFASAIILKERNELIGFTVLAKLSAPSETARLGWELDYRFWGKGYMTEAMQAATAFGFQYLGIRTLVADCFAANRASIRIMEKLGMGRQRDWAVHPWLLAWQYGELRPIVRYRL